MAQKKIIPEETPVKVYETAYTIAELAEAAKVLFGTDTIIATAALRMEGRDRYTEKEAKAIVKRFTEKEVK